ncbi:NUDIX domain-containing protein [Actinoplanes sp. NPDC051851]|uniref:NUDIX hydrolase n=1 Tax=Actinoplanes sp. NPDC051851 TaxID=3154753 RepID=UPI0034269110
MSNLRDVVNERDEVIRQAGKEEIQEQGLICRVAFIMLVNDEGELLLHQRAATKRSYPLYWSGAAAGHLNAGESYLECAIRETKEEIGLTVDLTEIGRFYSEPDREMVGVFLGRCDDLEDLTVEPMEVEKVEFFSLERLDERRPTMMITSYVERSLPLVLSHLR